MMKKVLTAILILSSVFVCTVFAADSPINIPITANVPDGSGETTPPDGSITVNGITVQFAIKGINNTNDSVPESWGAEGEGTNWQDIGTTVPTVYADLTGEVDQMTVEGVGSVDTYDSFYVCLQAVGNNLSKAASVDVSFSAENDAMTHTNTVDKVALKLESTSKNNSVTSDDIYFTNDGNTFTVYHPGKKIVDPVYGGYCHVSWTPSTAYQAGDYKGTIIVTVSGDTNPTTE